MTKKRSTKSTGKEVAVVENIPGAQFKVNEMCLAHHGPAVYEAKVLKQQKQGNVFSYFVHYNKWSHRWDEWVPTDRLMEKNEENIKKMKANQQAIKKNKAKGGRKNKEPPTKTSGKAAKKSKKTKKADDDSVEPEEERLQRKELKLKLPGQLKKYLVQDWENVTRQHKLVPLPRDPTVNMILDEWVKSKKNAEQNKIASEVAGGLRRFFNGGLSVLLLYRFERPQYEELMANQPKAKGDDDEGEGGVCDIYGAEHLARLFVKLPEILAHTNLDAKEMTTIQSKFTDFLKWFARNPANFCLDKYINTDTDYNQRVREVPL